MSNIVCREEYRLLSFELTDKFSAWFKDDDGDAFESPVHAIGMAALATLQVYSSTGETYHRKEFGNILVGLQLSEDGFCICEESSNFLCMLPNGEKPEEVASEPCFPAMCDTLLTELQAVIDSSRKRTYGDMKIVADRLTEMGASAAGMELGE